MRAANAREVLTVTIIRPPMPAFLPEEPLAWWRVLRPDRLFPKHSASLRMALAGTRMGSEPRWRDVVTADNGADGALAIGICVRQIRRHPIDAIEVDMAASATLAYALLGDAASAVVLSWALKHRAKIDPPCALLSDLWLIANF